MVAIENIKHIIASEGLKKKTVAEKSGFTEMAFSELLNYRKIFRVEHLVSICEALGRAPNEILGFANTSKEETK